MQWYAIGEPPVPDYHYSVPDQILDRFLRRVVKQDNISRRWSGAVQQDIMRIIAWKSAKSAEEEAQKAFSTANKWFSVLSSSCKLVSRSSAQNDAMIAMDC